jgi:glycosyltransferase involved in cell wall biosynthesis
MFTPKVSILLPVFNGQRYLRECLESVLAQSFGDFELLVGDDGSKDGSCEILEGLGDERIRLFSRERNIGLFPNENLLLKAARAPLVRFLCQDDALEPTCLGEEVVFFKRHSEIGMTFCKTINVDEQSQLVVETAVEDMPDILTPTLSLQLFYHFGCIAGNLSTVCARKKCFEQVGPFDPSYGVSADYEMWTRICERWPLGVVHQRLVRLRVHEGQLSRACASGVECVEANRRIRNLLLPKLPGVMRAAARRYARLRFDVIDVHHALHCLRSGRSSHFLRVVRALGGSRFFVGLVTWTLTLNNHLYRPKPRFISAA